MINEKPDTKPEEEKTQETISSTRVNPDHVFGSVAQKKEFIEKGKWIYEFEDHLYHDVLTAAYLEGFRVTQIEKTGENKIEIIIEEETTKKIELQHKEINTDENSL